MSFLTDGFTHPRLDGGGGGARFKDTASSTGGAGVAGVERSSLGASIGDTGGFWGTSLWMRRGVVGGTTCDVLRAAMPSKSDLI